MNNMNLDLGKNNTTGYRYTFKETVTGTSEPLVLSTSGRDSIVSVSDGSATVEFTISPFEDINEGNAVWFPWPNGEVAENTVDVVKSGVTALRLVSSGGATWEVSV